MKKIFLYLLLLSSLYSSAQQNSISGSPLDTGALSRGIVGVVRFINGQYRQTHTYLSALGGSGSGIIYPNLPSRYVNGYGFATLNTDSIPEGVALFFNGSRVRATAITGFVSSPGTVGVLDNIVQAFGKLDGNVGALTGTVNGHTTSIAANSTNITSNTTNITANTAAILLRVKYIDTAAMLVPYLKIAAAAATYQLIGSYATTSQLALKLNISDTTAMLGPYAKKTDSTILYRDATLGIGTGALATPMGADTLNWIASKFSLSHSGFLLANQSISFTPTGDVTGASTSATALTPVLSIGANKVTNAQRATMAAHTYKGNNTSGIANEADLTQAQLTAELNVFTTTLNGLVPAPVTSNTTDFLRRDGTWNAPTASGFVNPMTTLGDIITGGSAGAATRLPGNITTTKQWYFSTGAAGVATAPQLGPILVADVPTLNQATTSTAANITGVLGASSFPAMLGDVTNTVGTLTNAIGANVVTYSKFQQMVANSLHGNPTSGTATSQAIGIGATLAFSGTNLQTAAITGDITASANSFATVLATVNSNVFASNTFLKVAVNGKGLVTGAVAVAGSDIPTITEGQVTSLGTDLAARAPLPTAAPTLTAVGTTQGTGLVLVGNNSIQEVTTAASGTGVVLPVATATSSIVLVNRGANAINVYPATSGIINGQSVNIPFVLQPGASTKFYGKDAISWYSFNSRRGGDVNDVDGSNALTIGTNVVTNAKSAQIAAHSYKGNNTASTANALDLTNVQLVADLPVFTTLLNGLVPAPATSNTTDFLRRDGTWNAPAAGLSNPMTTLGDIITGGSAGAPTRLAGNLTTTKQWYFSTGAAGVATAPQLGPILVADVPTLNQATTSTASNITGVLTAASFPAMLGDVTNTVGTLTNAIVANAVTNAKAAQMAAHTYKGNNTASTANAIDLTKAQLLAELGALTDDPYITKLQDLGSVIKATGIGASDLGLANSAITLVTGQVRYIAFHLFKGQTLTGVKVNMRIAGVYTGSATNGAALYTSGSTITQVAISANTATIWTAAANTMLTIPFVTPYVAVPGLYWIALTWNNSAVTTAPQISGYAPVGQSSQLLGDMTSPGVQGFITGTTFPSTQLLSGLSTPPSAYWGAVY